MHGPLNTTGDVRLANPKSAEVARLSVDLVKILEARAGKNPLLPAGIALNVNFPDELADARWKLSRIGTYNSMELRFANDVAASASPETVAAARAHGVELPHLPGVTVVMNDKAPLPDQVDDESVVYRKDIAVSVMQLAYEPRPASRSWLRKHLRGFLGQ